MRLHMNEGRVRHGGRWSKHAARVRSWSFHVGSVRMGCQQAGFIMVMNPGGLSNYGCRWTERGGNPAEAFYLNHSSAPFKSIWQVPPPTPSLLKTTYLANDNHPPPLQMPRHERNSRVLNNILRERPPEHISSGYFPPNGAPWSLHPSHLPSVSIVISSQWSVGVHIPASSPQHQSATHSDRRRGARGEQAGARHTAPRISSGGRSLSSFSTSEAPLGLFVHFPTFL